MPRPLGTQCSAHTGLPLLEGMSTQLKKQLPQLCLSEADTDSGDKQQFWARNSSASTPGQQTPESRGLRSARGSDAITLQLWVSQEESVLLQRGCDWLWGPRPAPVPNPQQRGSRRSCLCAYTACCLPCFVYHSPASKGPAKEDMPGPRLLPSPCSGLRAALPANTCFL